MAELDLPKFVHLTLDESMPAPVAERLARTSYSPAELAARRKGLRRVFSSVLLGAGGLILIAGIVAAVGASRSSSPPRPVAAADQSPPTVPENGELQIPVTADDTSAADPAAQTAVHKTAPAPARKVGVKAKKPIIAHAPF
jgi:hypothetical protein